MVRKVFDRASWSAQVCAALLFCVSMGAQAQTTVNVSTAAQLQSAVSSANGAGGNRIISLADGTYTLNDTLYVNAPNISIVGASGNRANVIIQGTGMSSSASVGTIIRVAGSGFGLRYVTLQKSKYHLIQVVGEENADSPTIRDCILRDAYEQMVKVSIGSDPGVTADNGLVENCLFEYTAGIGPQYYIGGIDAHGAKNWNVRGNTFRNIASPSGSVAEFAVHFWNGSANNTVEKNVIIDCDRGIGFGLRDPPQQRWRDPQQHDLSLGQQPPVCRQRHRAFRESELEGLQQLCLPGEQLPLGDRVPLRLDQRHRSVQQPGEQADRCARWRQRNRVEQRDQCRRRLVREPLDRQPAPDLGAEQRGRQGQDHFRSYR